jgi:hypothetical protein
MPTCALHRPTLALLLLLQHCFGGGVLLGSSSSSTSSVTAGNRTTNPFGIGVYNDTGMGTDVQLPEAHALVGHSGFALLYFDLLFSRTGDPSSCDDGCVPPAWATSAMEQAYALGLTPMVRVGQWSRQIRNFSDDSAHRSYTALAAAYQAYIDRLPRPPDGSDLFVVLLNEPNVCGEWQCGDGAGVFLDSTSMAAEAARSVDGGVLSCQARRRRGRKPATAAVAVVLLS